MSAREHLFQIEIVEPSKRERPKKLLYDGILYRYNDNHEKVKREDFLPPAPTRTLLKRFKDHKAAERWGSNIGTVVACFKVDKTRYLENIEHLKLDPQTPISVGMDSGMFNIDKSLQVSRVSENVPNIVIDKG